MDADKQAAVDVCVRLLESLKLPGAAGRDEFLSTLTSHGTACHSRFMVSIIFPL